MSAREVATKDIKESLSIEGKCFLAFRTDLNDVMDQLVEEQLKAQELCSTNLKKVM
jgi:hypothetical protein